MNAIHGIEYQLGAGSGLKVDYLLEGEMNSDLSLYCNYERSGRASGLGHRFLRAFIVPELSVIENFNRDFIIDIADYRKRHPIGGDYFPHYDRTRRDAGGEAVQDAGGADAGMLEIIRECWQSIEQAAGRYRQEKPV